MEEKKSQDEEITQTEGQGNESVDQAFDAEAFLSGVDETNNVQEESSQEEAVAEESNDVNENEDNSQGNANSDLDTDDGLSWDVFSTAKDDSENESSEESQRESQGTEESQQQVQSTTAETTEETESSSSYDFSSINSKYGVELKSVSDIDQFIEKKNKEIEELRLSNPQYMNDKARNLLKIKERSDEDVFKVSLIAQGHTEENADRFVEDAIKDGSLKRNAELVRTQIDRQVALEQENQRKFAEQQDSQMQADAEENKKAIRSYLKEQDQMFGFNIAKSQDEAKKIKEKHARYITEGGFFNEITKDPQSVVEAAWLWKNREVVLNAFKTRGRNEAVKDFMEKQLGVPSKLSKSDQLAKAPSNPGEFDPQKFING